MVKNIVLVHDDKIVLEGMKVFLQQEGFEVHAFEKTLWSKDQPAGERKILELGQKREPVIVLIDVRCLPNVPDFDRIKGWNSKARIVVLDTIGLAELAAHSSSAQVVRARETLSGLGQKKMPYLEFKEPGAQWHLLMDVLSAIADQEKGGAGKLKFPANNYLYDLLLRTDERGGM